jgi:hypothetical protein
VGQLAGEREWARASALTYHTGFGGPKAKDRERRATVPKIWIQPLPIEQGGDDFPFLL